MVDWIIAWFEWAVILWIIVVCGVMALVNPPDKRRYPHPFDDEDSHKPSE